MKKRGDIISGYKEYIQLENIGTFGMDKEWQLNFARNYFLYTKFI